MVELVSDLMTRGERMKISALEPAVISGGTALSVDAASSMAPHKTLLLDGVDIGDGDGVSNGEIIKSIQSLARGVIKGRSVVNGKEYVTPSVSKREALIRSGAVMTEKMSPASSPSLFRPKKTTAHHVHRGSSPVQLHNGKLPADQPPRSAPPPARTPRQSASTFSRGIITSTPRTHPGARVDARDACPSYPRARASKSASLQRSLISRCVEDDSSTFCQDLNVQVVIRSRPVNGAEIALQGKFARCVRQENARTISWLGKPEARFTFDHIAGEFVTQGELFQVAGMPMVDNCMAGYNSCMFAYGQTGSGKTHTMLGDIEHSEDRGMTPRVFEYLFAMIRKEEGAQKQGSKVKYTCKCSFLEIYNEQISDLLEPSSSPPSANLQMREDVKKGVFVEGLLQVEVQSVEDVLHLLLLGMANRKVAATNVNRESSRSHCVFTCVIKIQWGCDSMSNVRFGRLHLVDLAGSERQKDNAGADGERLREAASINKSLSTLGHVIMVLVDIANGKQRHVPYRDSKLTFLLQDSLGGNSKTTIIANISPSSCASSETLSTLKFAQRAKFIQNNAVINEKLSSGDVKGMREEIKQLKEELARIRKQSVLPRTPSARRRNLDVDNTHLQERLIPRCLTYDAFDERKTKKVVMNVLDRNISMDDNAIARPQHEALVAELLAAERQRAEHLQNEVESHQRGLSECRIKLRISLESNERISRMLDALRLELQSSQEECRKCKQELATLQLLRRTREVVSCLELIKQPQCQQNVVLELKTLLQTVNTFQHGEIGDPETSYDLALSTDNGPCHGKESKRKVKHEEAILQLQMELASLNISGCASDAVQDRRIIGARLEPEEDLDKHLDATRDLQHQMKMDEEEIVEQVAAAASESDQIYWISVDVASGRCTVSKVVVLHSTCDQGYPESAKTDESVERLTRTQLVLLSTGDHSQGELDLKLLISEMVANLIQTTGSGDDTQSQGKEECLQDCCTNILKTIMVFSLDKENADNLQRQLAVVAIGALQKPGQISLQEEIQIKRKAEWYQAKSRKLKSQVQALQQELDEIVQPLRKMDILVADLVEELERSRGQLQEEVKRKQCAIEAVEEHLLKSEQSKLVCQEELHLSEQKAAVYKTRALEKQVEVEILKKSVEELENTVYALESQVGLLKREGEWQCSVRQDLERELQGLEQQNADFRKLDKEREDSSSEIQLLRKTLEKHQIGSDSGNLASCLSQPKDAMNIQTKMCKKNSKGSMGSAFRWFKMNHQVHSELNHEERKAYERRIQEMEDLLRGGQNEITALKEKLVDAERVTRAVTLRVLRGVKVDMANVADDGVERMLTQLDNFIDERESCWAVMNRKQAELTATQVALEKLQGREIALVAENKKFKIENRMQVKKMGQLEQEIIKALSGQHTNLHQAKIKNNNLQSAKLRSVEHVNTRIIGPADQQRSGQD